MSDIFCGAEVFGTQIAADGKPKSNLFQDIYRDYFMDETARKRELLRIKTEKEEAARLKKEKELQSKEEERLKKLKEQLSEADRLRLEEEEKKKAEKAGGGGIFSLPRSASPTGSPPISPTSATSPKPVSPPTASQAPLEKSSSFGKLFGFGRSASPTPAAKAEAKVEATPASPKLKKKKSADKAALAEETKARPSSPLRQSSIGKIFSSESTPATALPVEDETEVVKVTRQTSFRKAESLPGW